MSKEKSCPSNEELRRLSLSLLDEKTVARLQKHVANCELCSDTVNNLANPAGETSAFQSGAAQRWDDDTSEIDIANQDELPPPIQPIQTPNLEAASEQYEFLESPLNPSDVGSLEGYRILDVLGEGGMGIVFRAVDPKLNRQLAIKIVKPLYASNPNSKVRFLREARAIAAIDSDHIVAIHQVSDGEVPFIAMPLLKGESLAQRLANSGPLDTPDAVRIGMEIARGLAAAHNAGIIHRDIKPANIWLEQASNRVKLLDFGLARTDEVDGNLTTEGSIAGTPLYMSPEQIGAKQLDQRSDLYSLGCVLYRILAGKTPHSGPTPLAILMSIAQDPIPALASVTSDVPPALSKLVMKLLEKQREDRPESAEDVVEELEFIHRNLTSVTAVNQARSTSVGGSRKGLVVVLLCLLIGAVWAGTFVFRSPNGTVVVHTMDDSIQIEVRQGADFIEVIDANDGWTIELGEGQYDVSLRDTKDRFRLERDSIVVKRENETVLRVETKPNNPPASNSSGGSSKILAESIPGLIRTMPGHRAYIKAINLTSDGKIVQSISYLMHVISHDVTTGKLTSRHSVNKAVCSAQFATNQGLIAVGHFDSNAALWHSRTGERICEFAAGPEQKPLAHSVAISPDGKTAAVVYSPANVLSIYDATDGRVLHAELARYHGACHAMAFTSDGRFLATAANRIVRVYDLTKAERVAGVPIEYTPKSLEYAQDDSILISGGRGLIVWDAKTLAPIATLGEGILYCQSLDLSGDGRILVAGSLDRTIRVWDLKDECEVHRFNAPNHSTSHAAISSDGRTVVSGGGTGDMRSADGDFKIYVWRMPPSVLAYKDDAS